VFQTKEPQFFSISFSFQKNSVGSVFRRDSHFILLYNNNVWNNTTHLYFLNLQKRAHKKRLFVLYPFCFEAANCSYWFQESALYSFKKILKTRLYELLLMSFSYAYLKTEYIHTYHSRFIPDRVAGVSQIFLRDTHVLSKLN
jgi:hypothetical protein